MAKYALLFFVVVVVLLLREIENFRVVQAELIWVILKVSIRQSSLFRL